MRYETPDEHGKYECYICHQFHWGTVDTRYEEAKRKGQIPMPTIVELLDEPNVAKPTVPHVESRASQKEVPTPMLYQIIKTKLDEDFIKNEAVATVLAHAIHSGSNAIFYGDAGYGKSEAVRAGTLAVLDSMQLGPDELFIKSLGQGVTEADLMGGMDYAKMQKEGILEFHPERSFLAKTIAIFEEGLDAPYKTLNSLKNTLSARRLENGPQVFDMLTKSIIITTNKDPDMVANTGPETAALIQRFKYRLKVEWNSHKSSDYQELFEKALKKMPSTPYFGDIPKVLAEILGEIAERGSPQSPRVAKYALQALQTSAALRNAKKVEEADFKDLCYVDSLGNYMQDFIKRVELIRVESESRNILKSKIEEFSAASREIDSEKNSPIKVLQLVKKLQLMLTEVDRIRVTNQTSDAKYKLRNDIVARISTGKELALEHTR